MSSSLPRRKPNELFKLLFALFVITAIVAASLSVVNFITADQIVQTKQEQLNDLMHEVLEDAMSFTDLMYEVKPVWSNDVEILNVQCGMDVRGKVVGYCIEVAPKGYADRIDMMVGLNAEGEITKISIVSSSETPNVGTMITDVDFAEQFVGKSKVVLPVKGETDATNEVSIISGATKSAIGFTEGVNAAFQVYELVTKG